MRSMHRRAITIELSSPCARYLRSHDSNATLGLHAMRHNALCDREVILVIQASLFLLPHGCHLQLLLPAVPLMFECRDLTSIILSRHDPKLNSRLVMAK